MAVSLSARYGSPRSPEHPMAFTTVEFARGAGLAWLLFNLATPLTMGILSGAAEAIGAAIEGRAASGFSGIVLGYIMVSPFYLVPWSLGALIVVGAPAAFVLGQRMTRVASLRTHRWAFGILGAAVGGLTTAAFHVSVAVVEPGILIQWWAYPMMAALTSATVVAGWSSTSNRALKADLRSPSAPVGAEQNRR